MDLHHICFDCHKKKAKATLIGQRNLRLLFEQIYLVASHQQGLFLANVHFQCLKTFYTIHGIFFKKGLLPILTSWYEELQLFIISTKTYSSMCCDCILICEILQGSQVTISKHTMAYQM